MARLHDGKLVYAEPQRDEHYPGWWVVDCGCCAGTTWSGSEVPEECRDCEGGGRLFLHEASGTLAAWPGGPLRGRLTPTQVAARLAPTTGGTTNG